MKNLTEDHDFWGLPVEEKERPRSKSGLENIKQKKKIYEADQFLESINGRIGGLLIEFNNTKEELKFLYKEDAHGKSN